MSGNSKITISGSTFTDNYSETTGGSIYLSNYNSISIASSTFQSGVAITDGSEIYSNSGTLSLDTCTFTLTPSKSAISLLSTSFTGNKITMTNSNTSNTSKTATKGGGIYSKNSGSFTLSSSTFTSINYAEYGGAVYLDSDTKTAIPSSASHTLKNVTFTSNSAYQGGALYINNVDYVSIGNTTIAQNSAVSSSSVSGKGGGLYYASSSKFYNKLNAYSLIFSSSVFISMHTLIKFCFRSRWWIVLELQSTIINYENCFFI